MTNQAFLRRFLKTDYYTIGKLQIFNSNNNLVFECYTMELPFRDNEKTVSCIPCSTYNVILNQSPQFGKGYRILNVPNRSDILFHAGNYQEDTHGCILVGSDYKFINPHNHTMLLNSMKTMDKLMASKLGNFTLKIIELC